MQPTPPDGTGSRRDFLSGAASIAIGGVITLVPVVAGVMTALDPLHRRSSGPGGFVRVTSLDVLPADGVPRKFPIVADKTDAWNKYPNTPVGAVYLRRTADRDVQALNVVCPHTGCFVDYRAERKGYFCPCHNSSFAADGQINDPASPAPRGLDTLDVEIRNGNEVWVRFQNFHAGHKEKIPVA